MYKPRIFLGSSGKQEKLLQLLTRGLEDVAHVEPWTTSFNPGTTTLKRLVELAHEVAFAISESGRPEMQCPICDNPNAEDITFTTFDGRMIRCPECGDYDISGTLLAHQTLSDLTTSIRMAALQKARLRTRKECVR